MPSFNFLSKSRSNTLAPGYSSEGPALYTHSNPSAETIRGIEADSASAVHVPRDPESGYPEGDDDEIVNRDGMDSRRYDGGMLTMRGAVKYGVVKLRRE